MSAILSLLSREVSSNREQNAFSGRYIAIVDDEESVRRAFARLIRAYSFHAQTYGSGDGIPRFPEHKQASLSYR